MFSVQSIYEKNILLSTVMSTMHSEFGTAHFLGRKQTEECIPVSDFCLFVPVFDCLFVLGFAFSCPRLFLSFIA